MSDPGGPHDQHVADVYGYLAYEVGSRAEAEELTRAAFGRASRERSGGGRVSLLRAAHRAAADGRSRQRSEAGERVVSAELADALDGLERRERSVLALRFGARLAGRDAGLVLGMDETDVRRLLSRGLRRLRTALERQERRGEENDEA